MYLVRAYEAEDDSKLVQLHEHNSRFMNLQRHIWKNTAGTNNFDLAFVNPLAALNLEFLQNDGFKKSSLPMTPVDMYTLWMGMRDVCINIFYTRMYFKTYIVISN
jgi:hypothetical protein